jgi:Icc-related predicted phosphoesterase
MNILIISDDESIASRLPVSPSDLLISCGDLPDEIILSVAAKCQCGEIFAVKGNHDSSGPFRARIRDLHLVTLKFAGLTFGGFGGSWKYKPKGNFLFEQGEVEKLLATFPPVDVFVAHNSPRLVHDREDEVHIGFVAFNNYIDRTKPRFFLHGHQHQQIESRVGSTTVVGTFGYRFLVLPE